MNGRHRFRVGARVEIVCEIRTRIASLSAGTDVSQRFAANKRANSRESKRPKQPNKNVQSWNQLLNAEGHLLACWLIVTPYLEPSFDGFLT